ncbi:MAG: dienelactone hydrolase family protein [Xanthomonadaceae bacterium]|nr:dienelactone hydrolase family protein [Xanthomonadaceae bacterium]
MDPKVIRLFDAYTHGGLTRRDFLKRLAALAGSAAVAYALLPLLENSYAHAATVPEDDPRLLASEAGWSGGRSAVRGYLVVPKTVEHALGSVIVIHENRGLNPHIRDVARRLALAGFAALAPDGLSAVGGTPADEDAARGLFRELDADDSLTDFAYAIGFLKSHYWSNGKVGCVGFCWGGAMANRLAATQGDALAAAVSFYGMQAPLEQVPDIRAALQLHYAEHDPRVNAGMEAYADALRAAGVDFEQHVYPGTQHAFHNDTNAARHDAEAAALAWRRTVEFLRGKLRSQPG